MASRIQAFMLPIGETTLKIPMNAPLTVFMEPNVPALAGVRLGTMFSPEAGCVDRQFLVSPVGKTLPEKQSHILLGVLPVGSTAYAVLEVISPSKPAAKPEAKPVSEPKPKGKGKKKG